jgi:hypothetical protein
LSIFQIITPSNEKQEKKEEEQYHEGKKEQDAKHQEALAKARQNNLAIPQKNNHTPKNKTEQNSEKIKDGARS